jgi:hypothetical protein
MTQKIKLGDSYREKKMIKSVREENDFLDTLVYSNR